MVSEWSSIYSVDTLDKGMMCGTGEMAGRGWGVSEMAQWAKMLVAKSDDPNLIVGTHIVQAESQFMKVLL